MTIGNKPKEYSLAIPGKRYWWFSIGRDAIGYRYFDGGWYAFEFCVLAPFDETNPPGQMRKVAFRVAFAYWLPIYPL